LLYVGVLNLQKVYTLYNFDHGFKKEKTFRIGKYYIDVSDEQAKNLNKLEQNAKSSFVTNEDLSRRVEKIAHQPGVITETATLRLSEDDITPSLIYTELPHRSSIDDFILFLSFITGRRVFLEHELEQEVSTKYFDSVVNKNFFSLPAVDLDGGFKRLKELKLSTPFYNLVHTKAIRDLPAICFYANTIINALYERWCKKNGASTYPLSSIKIDEIKEHLAFKLERSLGDKVKIWVSAFLTNKSCDTDAKSDVIARINISNQPSAIYKFQKFLVGLDLFPENPSKEVVDRLKWVNKVRNMMVHMGDIPSDNKISFEQRAQITSSITFILIAIAEYYYAKEIFKVNNYLVDKNAEDVRKYFESGIFRGHKVFDETYEEFCERQELKWIENGDYA
jgi:hypothetical protein